MRGGTAEKKVTVPSFPGGGKEAEPHFKRSTMGGGGPRTQAAPGPQDARQAPRRLHDSPW